MPTAEICTGKAEGGFPCSLPAGHNQGHPDIPENHRAKRRIRTRVETVETKAVPGMLTVNIKIVREDDVAWGRRTTSERPLARDLPEDIRELLRVWLDQA